MAGQRRPCPLIGAVPTLRTALRRVIPTFQRNKSAATIPSASRQCSEGLQNPATPAVGEVWVATQFEATAGKTKPGTVSAVDGTSWQVRRKVALPAINMNNPHNMWTDRNQNLIYVTQWFDHKLAVYSRVTGALVRNVSVGEAPAHVMTRTDTDEVHVTNNGDLRTDAVMELAPLATGVERRIDIGRGNPHAHWMSHDGKKMATPNVFTGDTTQFDFPSDRIDSILPSGSRFTGANSSAHGGSSAL